MKIVFLGLQGAGKGVFSRMLAEELKIPLVSVGDILREKAEVKKYVDKGLEVPDEVVFDIIKKNLKESFILDGFPRTLNQIKLLGKIDKAIYIKIPEETGIKRLLGRRVCNKCKQIFNIHTQKPKRKGICDICGGKLVKRKDDTLELIKKRMEWSKRDLFPVIREYKKIGILEEVDGEGNADMVYERIRKLFKQ